VNASVTGRRLVGIYPVWLPSTESTGVVWQDLRPSGVSIVLWDDLAAAQDGAIAIKHDPSTGAWIQNDGLSSLESSWLLAFESSRADLRRALKGQAFEARFVPMREGVEWMVLRTAHGSVLATPIWLGAQELSSGPAVDGQVVKFGQLRPVAAMLHDQVSRRFSW
jgi:hypothetical protein